MVAHPFMPGNGSSFVLGNSMQEIVVDPPPLGIGGYYQVDFIATDPAHPGVLALGEPDWSPLSLGGHNSLLGISTTCMRTERPAAKSMAK